MKFPTNGIPVQRPNHNPGKIENNYSATTITSYSSGMFLENICALDSERVVISIHSENALHIINLVTGEIIHRCTLPDAPSGIVVAQDLSIFACTGTIGSAGYQIIKLNGDLSESNRFAHIPDALFLNGACVYNEEIWVVDSLLGRISAIDLLDGTVRHVFQSHQLGKASDEPMLPGANGIQIKNDLIYITNTDRAQILRFSIQADGSISTATLLADELVADDFCINDDLSLMITTHVHRSVMCFTRDGERSTIIGPNKMVDGCTAIIPHPTQKNTFLVTTTGGILEPMTGEIGPAYLLSITKES